MASERINTSLPDQLSNFVKRQVKDGGFSSGADYIRHVLRKEMHRTKEDQVLWINEELRRSEESGLSDSTPNEIRAGLKEVIKKAQVER